MKKEVFRTLVFALLVPVLFLVVWCVNYPKSIVARDLDKELESDSNRSTIMVTDIMGRGYVKYQELPEKLVLLGGESMLVSKTYDEETEELREVPVDFVSLLDAKNLKKVQDQIVAEGFSEDASGGMEFVFDDKQNKFTCTEMIQRIESLGFDGFSQRIEEIEKCVARNSESATQSGDDENAYWESDWESYYADCQGVRFLFERTSWKTFQVTVNANLSWCYAPQKYLPFIQQATESGDYYLISSCVGGEKEVLTFAKNNTITDLCYMYKKDDATSSLTRGRAFSFVFDENGQLVDGFSVSARTNPEFDETDRAFWEKMTKELGKELREKPIVVDSNSFLIYRTK
nr:hypothetical protein [Eubacterium sp.]